MTVTRRDLAIHLASLLAVGLVRPAWGQQDQESFRSLSARLTGFAQAAIDDELAAAMLQALRATATGAELDSLLQGAPAENDSELARQIIVAWYSGMHPTVTGGASLRAYTDALAWRALEFTKPPGQCSSAPGDWSEPPAGVGQAQ